ncbi:hypothetical protein B0T13DRAFT_490992 [Neurospora crassa]|nr:hypothetical protein B0T13DRAFT_490992 [Neurospora crassa]
MSAQMYQLGISGEGDGNTFYKDAEKKSSFRLFLLGLTKPHIIMSRECIMQVVPDFFLPKSRAFVFAALLTCTRISHCITIHALRRVPGELSLHIVHIHLGIRILN